MRIPPKYLFLFALAFVNTSLAGLILYISPVLSYVGSVDQIPIIIEGLLTGALFSSMAGFFLSLVSKVQKINLIFSISISTTFKQRLLKNIPYGYNEGITPC